MTNRFLTRALQIFLAGVVALLLAALAPIPAAAQSTNATYAYSINSNDRTITVSKVSTATGQVTAVSYIPYPSSEASPLALVLEATPTRNFVYVSDNTNNITEFQGDRVTGALTSIGSVVAGNFPSALFVDVNHQTLYVLNNSDDTVSAFTIGTFGALTSQGTTATGSGPVSMTMVQGSTQTYAYVVNQNDNSISQYTLCAPPLDCSPLGSLVPGQTFTTTGITLQAIAATPGGQTLYVSDQQGAALFAFAINPDTGVLTEPPTTFPTGKGPQSIAIDLQGQFLYTANSLDSTISAFTIGAGGVLAPILPTTILQGNGPVTVTIDPNGQLLYVIDQNSNTEETYGIAPAFEQITQPNGFLTFVASSNTRSGPAFFALAPAAVLAIPNEYFYATNANSNTISHAALDPTSGAVGAIVNTASQVNAPGAVIPDFTGLHIFIDNGTASNAQLTEFTITPFTGAINNSNPTGGAVPLVAGGNSQTLDPSGRFLYVATSIGGAVLLCPVNAGIVANACPEAVAVTDPVGVAVDPAGAFLYVLGTDGNDDFRVNVYSIDPGSGGLAQTDGSPYPTLITGGPNGVGVNQQIAIHPSGKFIAVTNGFDNIFTIFSVNGAGVLTKLADQSEQGIPQAFLFNATGTRLYEIESETGEINTFQFDPITGAISLAGSAPVGGIPGDAALDATGQVLLETAVADDANLTGSVAVYPIDPASGAPGEALTVTTLGFNTASIAAVAENVVAQFPTVTPIPDAAAFTPTPDNTSATAIDVTVNNFGTAPLNFTSIAILGGNPGDFALGPNTTCALGTPVPAAGSCILSVIFTPTVVGTRTATLTIIDNANPATQFVPLSGNGTASAPTVTLIPNALTFPSTAAGVPSAAMSTTLTNFGNAPLIFTAITIDAGANPGDFSMGPATTCSVQTPVAPSGTCVLSVVFTPTAAGNRAASLTLFDNAAPGTQTLPLTGTAAVASPIVGLNPTVATFPATPLNTTSAPISITVSNTGNVTLNFAVIAINAGANPGDFAIARGTTCNTDGGSAPASGSCTLVVTFTPTAAGTRSATLTLTDNATPAIQTIALTGNGGTGDFTITPPSTPIVVPNGQTSKFPITITPTNGFNPIVTFSAADPIPVGACVFYPQPNPATVTSAQTFNFLFTTNDPQQGTAAPIISPISSAPTSGQRLVQMLLAVCLLAALIAMLIARKLHPRNFSWTGAAVVVPALLLTFAALTFVGCGGGGNRNALVRNASSTSSSQTRGITQPGTYQITIVATTGAITHSTTVIITIR
jgi:6-phosphogluconolactonase (cycloisomerase 2 family)